MFADNIFWATRFVICVYCVSVSNCDTRTGNRCIEELSRSLTVQLQCSAGEWIHVEQEAYGDGDAATCRLTSAQSCTKVYNSSQNGLIVNCNGKQSCREVITATPQTNCNLTDVAAEVNYTCIKDSKDMCSTDRTAVNGSVYLHSPGFNNSVDVSSSCVVGITGMDMRITLVEERMKVGLLNISGDGNQLWTSVNVDQYNRVLPGTASELEIVYTNHDQNGSNVWIRVDASGQMNITPKGQILETTTTPVPTSTLQTSRSQGTTSQSTSATPTTATTTPSTTLNKSTTTEDDTVDSTTNEKSASTSLPSATEESTTTEEATVDSTTKETTASTSPPSATGHVNETSTVQSSPVTSSFPTDTSASISTPWTSKSSTIKQQSEGTASTISTMHMGTTVPSVSASVDLIVAACAASGVVLTVVVITIVLCRRKQTGYALPFQLNASESAAPSNTNLVPFLTITTGSTEEVHDTGTTSKQADTRPEHDLYSEVLPKSSRFKRGNNKECEKDTEMMDTCLYSPSKMELIDERTDDANIENTDTCLIDCDNVEAAACCMMENDIYCSGPATPEIPANRSLECGDMPKEKCCMIENDIYSSG